MLTNPGRNGNHMDKESGRAADAKAKAHATAKLAKAETAKTDRKTARVKEERKKRGVKAVERTVELQDGVAVAVSDGSFTARGPKGQLTRAFPGYVKVSVEGGKVTFLCEGDRKRTAISGTLAAHLKNMMIGVTKGYEGRMKVVHSHFPMKVSVEGRIVVIQNFLGKRKSKRVEGMGDVKIRVDKDFVIVTGIDKEAVGQTMARIERETHIKDFDRRVFQDGIYITLKPVPEGSIAAPSA